jgi:hypothetical protein
LKQHILSRHTLPIEHKPTPPVSQPKKRPVGRPKLNKCPCCRKTFSSKYTLDRHIARKTCETQEPTTDTKSNIQEIIAAYEQGKNAHNLEQQNNSNNGNIQSGHNNNMTVNTDNHTENIITQNNNNALYVQEVHINPIGKENLSHISDATILQILNQGVNAVPALAKAIMELPENCNIVESDKRNRKATVVNRDGDVEVMDMSKALTMSATETVDRVDDYYEKFKNYLPKKNKSIQRMARAHGLDSDAESEDEIPKGETYDDYFKKYMSQIKDNIEVHKKPILARINKYKEHKHKAQFASKMQSQHVLV